MSLTAFTHGITLAIGLILALGPQNVFVFQQGALQPDISRALPTVLTAGLSDTLLILLGVLGVSAVVIEFSWLQTTLFGAGFVMLVYIGWTLYTAPAVEVNPHTQEFLGVREQVGFTASVSLLNPHAILDTVGVIGTNALAYTTPDRWVFTAGCLIVSWGWFSGLAITGRALGESANANLWMKYLNVVSAVIVWIVALYMGWQFIHLLAIV
ncbi:LysE/ArgO family amino acid transporter [Haloquadratum walsbyi]|jgi:Lysine efflux permease|uniref:LysE/ArgO family amino acid transporter n=1 Tax=Haloquadratum walsbyi TaxID=293091 RepID=UPI0023F55F70|nr:LysE family transporter [Haloquadratum walsbyi]